MIELGSVVVTTSTALGGLPHSPHERAAAAAGIDHHDFGVRRQVFQIGDKSFLRRGRTLGRLRPRPSAPESTWMPEGPRSSTSCTVRRAGQHVDDRAARCVLAARWAFPP